VQRWEYCRIYATWSVYKNDLVTCTDGAASSHHVPNVDETFADTALELGREGWELVSMVAPGDMGTTVVAVFKRPIP
jgi:hypothetical protein